MYRVIVLLSALLIGSITPFSGALAAEDEEAAAADAAVTIATVEITMKAVGTALEYSDEKKTIFNTDVTYISGKGKYLGITGSGRMTGQRKNRVESGAPVFLEVTSTYENR